jgi:hypothetical protein
LRGRKSVIKGILGCAMVSKVSHNYMSCCKVFYVVGGHATCLILEIGGIGRREVKEVKGLGVKD